MKHSNFKKGIIALSLMITLLMFFNVNLKAEEKNEYGQSYRNHLSYSAQEGWNNDPNGLIYIDGVYHMYYQYNWNEEASQTDIGWGHMSWGHATSTDLVNWKEKEVALPAHQTVDGVYYDMMFSGSAVYDVNNTSGLFEVDENGKLKEGHGIVALLTSPADKQRQILAYSLDGGDSFNIYGEVLPSDNPGSLNDDEFRDPKVFWSDIHNKWLMVIGGGAVRMYSSSNLKEWEFIGYTGFWGECPDISIFEVDGKLKYVLILSPEDKPNSHKFNQTSRAEYFYPAEYYTVGDLSEDGLFISSQPLKRLSDGIDSYAFQSFNNTPDGKVYGISWSASWKNVDSYKDFRKVYNGGMTIACELDLVKDSSGYSVSRKPVEGFKDLRKEQLINYEGKIKDNNVLNNVNTDIADIELVLDFADSKANLVTLELRKSSLEKVVITYNKSKEKLILDRSNSSLLAEDTPYYNWVNEINNVELVDNKLTIRILLDRAFISLFVNDGQNSLFSAIFPSAISNGMNIYADEEISANIDIWSMNSIFGEVDFIDETIVSTDKLDMLVGEEKNIIASSFASNSIFDFSIKEGKDIVNFYQSGNIAVIKAIKPGVAKVIAAGKEVTIYIYENGYNSDLEYDASLYGYSYINENGLVFDYSSDAFLFSNQSVNDFIYSSNVKINENGQAAGLLFGLSDNYSDYLVATVDIKDNLVKLWRSGVGDLKVAEYEFNGNECKVTVEVQNQTVKIRINDSSTPVIIYLLEDYTGGKLGLNVYNSSTTFNNIRLEEIVNFIFEGNDVNINISGEIEKIVNITDNSYRLASNEYSFENNVVNISRDYLYTLRGNDEYIFRIITTDGYYDRVIMTNFTGSSISSEKNEYNNNDNIIFTLVGATEIKGVYLDGKLINDYSISNNEIHLSDEIIMYLTTGSHEIIVYTENGRPNFEFRVVEVFDVVEDEITANHIFFYVDIAIFAGFIIVYVLYSIIKKKKELR